MVKRLLSAVVLVSVLASLVVWNVPEAKAVIVTKRLTFTSLAYDGGIAHGGPTYDICSNATTGTVISGSLFPLGQVFDGGSYDVQRGFFFFDTEILPDGITNFNVSLEFYADVPYAVTGYNLTIQNGQPTYPHIPLEPGDFYKVYYSGNGGTVNTTGWSSSGAWRYINFTLEGEVWVNKYGITKLCIRSSRDIGGQTPTSMEYVRVYTSESGYAPKLVVTYEGEIYPYSFHALYNEQGVFLNTSVSVTAYYEGEVDSETFSVNGTYTYNTTIVPLYFHFELGAKDRQWWLAPTETSADIYVYNDTFTTYTVSFLDLAGILSEYSYVDAKRWINGFLRTVERKKVDEENKVIFNLVQDTRYTITVGNGETHTFGDVTFTSDTSISLTLRGIDFPKETLLTSKYVRIYGDRALGTPNGSIIITYQDTLEQTVSVNVLINYKNGTNAGGYYFTGYSGFTYNWTQAKNDTDYAVVCAINHQRYGAYTWKQYFPRSFSEAPWGLDWMGKLPFDTSILLPGFLILCAFGCFSVLNAYIGAFAGTVTAMLLSYMGWINIPSATLIVALIFTVLVALGMLKRRVET